MSQASPLRPHVLVLLGAGSFVLAMYLVLLKAGGAEFGYELIGVPLLASGVLLGVKFSRDVFG